MEKPSRPVSRYFAILRQAIEERQKVEIDYYSFMRDKTGPRAVRPYFLMNSLGYWYLTGYCEMREDLRTFKFERILRVKLLKDRFPPPEDLDVDRYKENFLKSMGRRRVEIHFDAEVAPWIQEWWSSSVRKGKNGGVVLSLFSDTLEYPSRLVLSYAPYAKPLSPPELIEKVQQDSRELLQLYGT